MKVIIPGGSGQVGAVLSRAFVADGHDVVLLSRQPVPAAGRVVVWDGEHLGPWATELEGADVVINLAGRSVNCRYNAANRKAIVDSRVQSTRVIGRAIAAAARPPKVWLQASTATIYAHRFDAAWLASSKEGWAGAPGELPRGLERRAGRRSIHAS